MNLDNKEKSNISHSEIIPPKLGSKHFGKILVHYKIPLYK
ncbi:conserved protein of unknown function [Legionella micdadei]|uniref:Uncharacterized protein n=1 Tax=Legionella micdadei TaxID=451 RepID=A0A098GG72_LEGMI|nr:conserved protein of unknown function [Legionella micdadei]SCY70043.1 hypothetical protein SAMN02982997_02556 [Legionella micdadei]